MNILTIIVILIIAAFGLNGYRRGFVRVFTSMFFFLGISVMVYFMTPYISDFLKEYTPVYTIVEESCREALEGSLEGDGEAGSKIEQKKYIEGMDLPEIIKKQLINNNNSSGYADLAISGFVDYVSGYLANMILNLLTFVITMILANIVWRLMVRTLNTVSRLPGLHGVNRYTGMAFGVIQGLLIVWIGFLILTAFGQTEGGKQLMQMIRQSPILEFLYDSNIFLQFLLPMINRFL